MENQQRDEMLWQIVGRRAAFKASFGSYIVVTLALAAIWYFSSGPNSYFCPLWPAIGWGLGVAM